MKDKEMAKILCEYCYDMTEEKECPYSEHEESMRLCLKSQLDIAKKLYNAGYRKITDSVVLTKEELEEKYEPSEKFMSVVRELEDLKQNLEDKVVLSGEEYEKLLEQRRKARSEKKRFKNKYLALKTNNVVLTKAEYEELLKVNKADLAEQANYTRKETAEKFYDKVMSFIGSNQKFWIVDDEHITIIDVDKLFDFVMETAKQFGVIKE